MNIIKKFLAKKEEKEDLEKFLCTLKDPKPCKKIRWWDFFKSFKEYLLQKQPKNDVNIDKLSNLQIFSNK